ncbi:nucleoid-associated protein YgaU [Kitasatospora gansuensis]|uniref:Nucleoid-associated protein YgaU n=1 Tax=Kitasatospora gansuensis TaxID=258050 RepID=A0A7W7S940_9ACTN|nr:transglycosylase family protein [Kitasatospora gansuensis]MBB4946160.1 nucleoid-associated protein YgaU [Kitasatospora gansuensis]
MTFRNETAAATTAVKRNRVRLAVMGGAVAVLPVAGLVTANSASAASVSTWDKVAQCESTGDWSIANGNGFYGGLQFTSSTWAAFGGTSYAPQANQASKAQQIAVAEKVLASQGPGAWPVCSVKAGLTKGGAAADVDTSAGTSSSNKASRSETRAQAPKSTATAAPKAETKAAAAPKAAAPKVETKAAAPKAATPKAETKAPAAKSNGGNYTIKSGDTLSKIAADKGLDWKTVYSNNASVLGGNPDLIFPGQVISL